jgi:hypothetical protein
MEFKNFRANIRDYNFKKYYIQLYHIKYVIILKSANLLVNYVFYSKFVRK